MNETVKKGAGKLVLLCWFAYAVSYIGRLNYSACMSDIMSEMQIAKDFAGTISTGYLAAYGCGQLVNGILGDKINPRYMIFVGLIGAGSANILMGISQNKWMLLVFWCLNGIFNSMLWSPVIRAFAEWLPKEKQPAAGANIQSTIPAGKIASYLISSLCLHFLSWRITFAVIGCILISYAFVWYFGIGKMKNYIADVVIFKQTEDNIVQNNEPKKNKSVSLVKCIIATGLIFAVINIFANGMIKDGVTQWVPTYIKDMFSVGSDTASAVTMILPVVELGGAYLSQIIFKKLKNEMSTCAVMWTICTIAIGCLILFGKANMISAVALVAISTSSMLGVNSMLLTFIPLNYANVGRSASVTGFLNACSYIASAASSIVFGFIAEKSGWNATMYSWLIISAVGLISATFAISVWSRGKKKISTLAK